MKYTFPESIKCLQNGGGVYGFGNRFELPTCVIQSIRERYPDDEYMGFKNR